MNRLAIVFVMGALSVTAQIPADQTTDAFKNGRYWAALSETSRLDS